MKTLNINLSDSSPYIYIKKDNYTQSKNFICNSYIAFDETMYSWLYISLFKYSIINIFRSLFKLKPIIFIT